MLVSNRRITNDLSSIYLAVAPIAVFFLTLERCLVLVFSLTYESRLKRLAHSLSIITLFIALLICVTFTLLELPLNQDGKPAHDLFDNAKGMLQRTSAVYLRARY